MIRKTEKYFTKKVITHNSSFKNLRSYGSQNIKRTTYWLFYIIPIFSKDEVLSGSCEDRRK